MPERTFSKPIAVHRLIGLGVAVLVFASDQLTKWLVGETVAEHAVISIIPGCFNLTHVKNPGAAFGLLSDSPTTWKTVLLIVISVALLAFVGSMFWRSGQLHWLSEIGMAMVFGGAFSNLLDRVRYGHVVDFLDFYVRGYHWPAFNVADSAIVIGAGVLILHLVISD